MNTPILFLIFNRPDTTQKVFNEIRKQQPKYLYVAADGPRSTKIGESDKCNQTRDILKQIDWTCELKTLFRDENIGCGKAVSSAISWFFQHVEEGIILEDDCLPEPTFFKFCAELLDRYRDNAKIMHIGGSSLDGMDNQKNNPEDPDSYYLSRHNFIWGWATWRRAWEKYDFELFSFESFKTSNKIKTIFPLRQEQKLWIDNFQKTKNKEINTWDYQWYFSIWNNNGFAVLPFYNLITNIGLCHIDSTHTNVDKSNLAHRKVYNLDIIHHPVKLHYNPKADRFAYSILYKPPSLITKIGFNLRHPVKSFRKHLLKFSN